MRKLASLLLVASACGDVVPPVDVTISPAMPVTTDDLIANVDDGGGRSLTYRWMNGGAAGPTGNTVSADMTTKGDVWMVEVSDGDFVVGTAQVTIANSPATVPTPTLKGALVSAAPLTCVSTPMDPDGDPLTITIAWFKDNAPFSGTTATKTIPNDTIPAATTHVGETYRCEITATDGGPTAPARGQVTSPMIAPRIGYTVTENPSAANLQKIDLETGTITDIGPMGVGYNFGDLAWDRVNQKLYMIDGRGAQSLYTVDTTTGVATLIGKHSLNDLFALGFAPTGLYAASNGAGPQLYKLDTTNGQPMLIGTMSASGGYVEGLVFDTKRNVFIGQTNAGGFYSVDVTNASVTALGGAGPSINDFGLTYDEYVDRYVTLDYNNNLQTYDPTTYAPTLVRGSLGPHTSIAIPLPPP